jgi:hypothetical protein
MRKGKGNILALTTAAAFLASGCGGSTEAYTPPPECAILSIDGQEPEVNPPSYPTGGVAESLQVIQGRVYLTGEAVIEVATGDDLSDSYTAYPNYGPWNGEVVEHTLNRPNTILPPELDIPGLGYVVLSPLCVTTETNETGVHIPAIDLPTM